MTSTSRSLSEGIRARRKELRLSQRELGQRCGLTQSAISAFERGSALPTLRTLDRLADTLDVTVQELLEARA